MKKTFALLLTICLLLAVPGLAAAAESPFVGSWRFYAQEGDPEKGTSGLTVTHEQVVAMAEQQGFDTGNAMTATLLDGGVLRVNVYGSLIEEVWTDNGDGTGVFNMRGQAYPMTVRDGLLCIDMDLYTYVLEPCQRSAEEAAAAMAALYPSTVKPEPSAEPKVPSLLVGEWRFYDRTSDDPERAVSHEALPELREQGLDYAAEETLSIEADGDFKACDFYGFERNSWTDTGDNTGTFPINGERCAASIEDGLLVLRGEDSVTRYEKTVAIGTTGYLVAVPADYVEGEVTEDERKDDMIAYYRSDLHLMDFDVYQFAAEGQTLAAYAKAEAEKYGAKEVESLEIAGVAFARYYSEEAYDGGSYRVANYLFAAGDDFGELSFWLDGDDAETLVEGIVSSLTAVKPEEEDLRGTVVEKLEGDYFPDRYLVKTDGGETYEAEYIGFEDLEPGTEVTLSKWGRDWMIELEDDWSWSGGGQGAPEGVFTTKDGIIIDELRVSLAGGRAWSFGYALYNPSDETAYFDPSPFVLKNADGREIKTAVTYVSPDEIWANNTTRVSVTIMTTDYVHLGDEISVWYDGAFLGTVTAAEF